MNQNYIQTHYGVPAEVGRRVTYTCDKAHKQGVITEVCGHQIRIQFDGDDRPRGPFHPTWELVYGEMGVAPKSKRTTKKSRSQRRYQQYLSSDSCWKDFAHFLAALGEGNRLKKLGLETGSWPVDN